MLLSGTNGSRLSLYDSMRYSGTATVVENLQTELKLREGEIQQLQARFYLNRIIAVLLTIVICYRKIYRT